ncbi:hypothetical protein [Pectobacterium carotovorum]|uniref:hypothetical protein n=1 Tax=Pectobacterium carotovorum TaxID=554 RepID=UPI003017518D
MDLNNLDNARKSFFICQNKFRGLVSEFKSKKFVENRRFDPSFLFRRKFKDLMLEARIVLHPSTFFEYHQWVNYHIKYQMPELSKIPIQYDDLDGVSRKSQAIKIEREIQWIVSRIKANAEIINYFCHEVSILELMIKRNHYYSAIETLKILESNLGASLWSVQIRIALEYLNGGLENQKKYTAEVRSIYRNGLLNFIAYNTSIRNEDRVSIHKFNIDVTARIENHTRYSDSVKQYLHYRMKGEWPEINEKIAEVLCVEQNHSLIDIYNSFINLAQYSVSQKENISLQNAMKNSLSQINEINDFRINKCQDALKNTKFNGNRIDKDMKILNSLLEGNVSLSLKEFRKKQHQNFGHIDSWDMIFAGFSLSYGKLTTQKYHVKSIPIYISQIIRQDENAILGQINLMKIATNLSGLPSFTGLIAFVKQIYRDYPDSPWDFSEITLHTPSNLDSNILTSTLLDLSSDEKTALTKNLKLSNETESIKKVLTCLNVGEFKNAIKILDTSSITRPALNYQMYLHALYGDGNRKEVIKYIANTGTSNKQSILLMPIVSTLFNFRREDFDNFDELLTPSIALHMLWELTEDEKVISRLRFKASEVIRKKEIRSPVALEKFKGKIALKDIIYFLKNICVPNIIDQARVVKQTNDILKQRMDTCALLRTLDDENSSDYEDEILEISHRLTLSAGQMIVDRTRVHVDVSALMRWVNREISEDIYRYRDLAKVVTTAEFDEVIRELLIENQLSAQFSEFDEADTLLYSILVKIGNEFVSNPLFGLDYYLSKRIRHQSFVGLIRGPLQEKNIISPKETKDSDYIRNDLWLEKFSSLSKDAIASLDNAFRKFSSEFDNLILETKDNIIQINSKEHPQGLMKLEIQPQLIPVARYLLHDGDIDTFVKASVGLMWALLDHSLREIQDYISLTLKPQITSVIDTFRTEVKSITESKAAYYELDRTIGHSSVQVQLALDDASSWFQKMADLDAFKKSFNLDQALEISLTAAKKCLRGFDPNVRTSPLPEGFHVAPSTLVFLHDVIFVSLDNARIHSGLKKPTIHIEVSTDIKNEKFTIRTRSQSKLSSRASSEKKLAEIRKKIDRGEYETKTKTEGGSGLYKIAAVVKQSPHGDISFGFSSGGDFEVTVVYHYFSKNRTMDEIL